MGLPSLSHAVMFAEGPSHSPQSPTHERVRPMVPLPQSGAVHAVVSLHTDQLLSEPGVEVSNVELK